MDKTFPEDPAFTAVQGTGLSKREYFAAVALQGLLANPNISFAEDADIHALEAVRQADKLIKELNEDIS